jgi:FlaA1/EpsC-like NDP-sugar epimerase
VDWYRLYMLIACAVGAAACIAFCADYYRLSRGFRRSEFWWIFMGFPATLGVVLLFILASRVVPDSWVRQVVGAILSTILIAIVPLKHRIMRKAMRSPDNHQEKLPSK